MEIRNVKTFIKVAELENFSRAAAELGYAQSTVTAQIKALEQELAVALFQRNGKRVTLSAAGEEFRQYAYELLRCEQMALEHFNSECTPRGPLRIGVMESICASRYLEIFKIFMKMYPDVHLTTMIATTLECMDMLERGNVDVILTLDKKITHPNWETAHTLETEISFFCSSAHPFADRSVVSLEELIQEPFIQVEEGCNYRKAFEQYLASQGKRVVNVQEVGYTRMIIDCVEENTGISLLPRFTLEEALREGGIRLIHVKDYSILMWIQAIYSKNKWASPALRAFLDLTKQCLK